MTISARAPTWVGILVRRVCTELGLPEIDVIWRQGSRAFSTGGFNVDRYSYRIVVTAACVPADENEVRNLLLHELAHYATWSKTRSVAHSKEFWRQAWRLIKRHGDVASALPRETCYRRAARVAIELRIKGAREALAARRVTRS